MWCNITYDFSLNFDVNIPTMLGSCHMFEVNNDFQIKEFQNWSKKNIWVV